ncbi:MAG: AmmeMemoRadiSam system protein B [Planctomycetota bacterium]
MTVRQPVRAGSFYESSPDACRRHARKLLDSARLPEDLPETLYGGVVPHAGWAFSGRLAAETLKALHQAKPLETVVVFGADHVGVVRSAEVYAEGAWRTPLGDVPIAEDVATEILAADGELRSDPDAHGYEHSIEVQIPLIAECAAEARIVPVAVPPHELAVTAGRTVGRVLAEHFPDARVIGSTDLTHHGGHFPAPGGRGMRGVEWTRENDRRMLELIEAMDAEGILREAAERGNACGAGALAAAVAAARQMGASRGIVLEYTNSYEVIHEMCPDEPDDTTVGYASAVFA